MTVQEAQEALKKEDLSLEELLTLASDSGVQGVFADPTYGVEWKAYFEKRLLEAATPPVVEKEEEPKVGPPPTEVTAPPPEAKAVAPPMATAAQAAKPEEVTVTIDDIDAVIARHRDSEQAKYEAYGRAKEGLIDALGEERLIIPAYHEKQVGAGDRSIRAFNWLVWEIVNGNLTVAEAIKFAKEQDWVLGVEADPRIVRNLNERLEAEGLMFIKPFSDKEKKVYPATLLAKALQGGTLTVEEAIQKAKAGGLTRPIPDRPETLEERVGPDKVAEMKEASRGRAGRRRTTTRKK